MWLYSELSQIRGNDAIVGSEGRNYDVSIRCSTSRNEENGRLYHSVGAVSVTELWRRQIERVRSQRHGLGEILEQQE